MDLGRNTEIKGGKEEATLALTAACQHWHDSSTHLHTRGFPVHCFKFVKPLCLASVELELDRGFLQPTNG